MARALTGWRRDWSAQKANHNVRYDATWHDATNKTIFGRTGNFDWGDAVCSLPGHEDRGMRATLSVR
jgi:uncharacterized protein (DUF1800 family)